MGLFKFFSKEKKETLDSGLNKTKEGLFSKLKKAVAGKSKIDDDVLDNLEEVFITSDVGVETTLKILDRIQARVARDKYASTAELNDMLCEEITQLLADNDNTNREDFEQLPMSSSRFGASAWECRLSSIRWAQTPLRWPTTPWQVPRLRMPTW